MNDWKDILAGKEEKLTDEDLLRYLDNDLSEEEKNVLEKKVIDSFESDAIDGLQQIKDTDKLRRHVRHLNKKLPYLLRLKKHRLEKNSLKDFQWIILAIIVLLFLCTMGYVIITMYK